MKVALISTYDTFQGAARATYRLHQGLQQQGVESYLLVNKKFSDDPFVLSPTTAPGMAIAQMRARIDQFPLRFYPHRPTTYFSPQACPDGLAARIEALDPDIINIHWAHAGFLQLESLAKFKLPMVLTLHDMWALTGGCHYTDGCDRYLRGCGQCPQLASHKQTDLSKRIWQRKAKAWQNLNLTVVTPSQWLGDCVKQSPLLQRYPLQVIANGLDSSRYKPLDKAIAKDLLGLPKDNYLLGFGAIRATQDRRKGFFLLKEAIAQLAQTEWRDKIQLLIFGDQARDNGPNFDLPTHYLGQLEDDLSLRIVYSAADAFLAPSLEDNLPNTVLEALACGTPCIAFKIGGIPDLIQPPLNGYLAEPFKIEDFVRGVIQTLRHSPSQKEREQLQANFEQKFSLVQQAKSYQAVFENLLKDSKKTPKSR